MPGPAPAHSAVRRSLIILLTALAAVLLYYLLPHRIGPVAIHELQRRMIAIFVVAAVFWATEVLPLFATSLMVIGMEVLFLAEKGGLAGATWLPTVGPMPSHIHLGYHHFLDSFGSGIIILFMGGFLLSAALTRHGIDRAIAARILQPFTRSPALLLFGVLAITAFFSMWMSNTATTAMMLAIVAPIIRQLPREDVFHRGLILAVPFGANIGGIGTPIGTPPNAIAFENLNAAGLKITFMDWVLMAVPLELLMLAVVGVLLLLFFKPRGKLALGRIQGPEKIGLPGWITLAVMTLAIGLWLTGKLTGLHYATVALLVAAALTAFKILDRSDVDSIDWNVLILMWGGLSLGDAMRLTGLTELIRAIDFSTLPGGPWGLAAVVLLVAVGLSTFMSHTAAAGLLVPIITGLSLGSAQGRGELALLAALGCSFAMAMPVSTPPNAIAFATGRVPVGSMIRSGGLISLIAIVAMLVGYKMVIPRILTFGLPVGP